MKYMYKYECRQIVDGNIELKLIPVENFPDICVCVNPNSNPITIFDGGSTLSVIREVFNFSSQEFLEKVVEVCKKFKVSKKGKVFYLECYEKDFDARLNDFIMALQEICRL